MAEFEVKSEMTGVVGAVLVSVGDVVAEDDPLIMVESMKMEIMIFAPRAGRVAAIRAAKGDPIAEGDSPVTLAV
jgi:biotin carboxyl carrier protein